MFSSRFTTVTITPNGYMRTLDPLAVAPHADSLGANNDVLPLHTACAFGWLPLNWGLAYVLVGVSLLCTGCHSTAIRARSLPNEFRANTSARNKSIDLSRLSSPGTGEFVIAPSDLLEISIASGRDDEEVTPFVARVAENGSVQLPVVGTVMVAGLEPYLAGHNIEQAAIDRGMYRHPIVTVDFKSKAVNHITVLGAVNTPGEHEIPRGVSDVVTALAAAGGLTEEAGYEVEIIRQPRPGTFLGEADVAAPLHNAIDPAADDVQLTAYQSLGTKDPKRTANLPKVGWTAPQKLKIDLSGQSPTWGADFRLYDRDVVRAIPRKKEIIHVDGLVKKPGQMELPVDEDINLLDAIAMAGGLSSPVADKVYVIRRLPNRPEPVVIQASLFRAKRHSNENLRLMVGDTVTVEQTPATAVVGAISQMFRASVGVSSRVLY